MAGKDIKILTEIFTPRQFAALIEEVSGKKVELKETSLEAFRLVTTKSSGDLFTSEIYGKCVVALLLIFYFQNLNNHY